MTTQLSLDKPENMGGNADALSHLPACNDLQFDGQEMGEDVDNVCTVCMISLQIMQDDPKLLFKETSKDPVPTQVMRCVKEGWPNQCPDEFQDYKKWLTRYPLNMVTNSTCQEL